MRCDTLMKEISENAGLVVTAVGILALQGGVRTLEERAMNAWGHYEPYIAYRDSTRLLFPFPPVMRSTA